MTTRNPFDRLASLGEEVLGKAAQNPAASRFVQSAMQMKERVDDLTKRVRGLEAMEQRVEKLEKRLSKLESTAARKPTATAKKSTTAAKPAAKPPTG